MGDAFYDIKFIERDSKRWWFCSATEFFPIWRTLLPLLYWNRAELLLDFFIFDTQLSNLHCQFHQVVPKKL
jgi:hypothetical protein